MPRSGQSEICSAVPSFQRCQASSLTPLDPHIRDDGADAERLAGKADAEGVAHEAAPAIGADEIARGDALVAAAPRDNGRHGVLVLGEALQLAAELDAMAELGQALAHHAFGQELRHHPTSGVGSRSSMTGSSLKPPSAYSRCGG